MFLSQVTVSVQQSNYFRIQGRTSTIVYVSASDYYSIGSFLLLWNAFVRNENKCMVLRVCVKLKRLKTV